LIGSPFVEHRHWPALGQCQRQHKAPPLAARQLLLVKNLRRVGR
jgi:hypothetical protein